MIHACLPLLRRSVRPRVVNLSSQLGSLRLLADRDSPVSAHGMLAYGSSKCALNAVTVLYANTLREEGILVNAANPGFVATDLNDHRGVLSVEEGPSHPPLDPPPRRIGRDADSGRASARTWHIGRERSASSPQR